MTDEPVRIEFTTNAPEATAAIESINAALLKIPSSGAAAGQGIDSFVSHSMASLNSLSAEINRVAGELRSMGTAMPTSPRGVAQPLSRWDEAARRLEGQAQGTTTATTAPVVPVTPPAQPPTATAAAPIPVEVVREMPSVARTQNPPSPTGETYEQQSARILRESQAATALRQVQATETTTRPTYSLAQEQQVQAGFANPQAAMFKQAYDIGGEEAGRSYAQTVGKDYETLAQQAGVATQATQQLGQAQQQTIPAAQQLSATQASVMSSVGGSTKTLGELGKELSVARKEFDGSPASVTRLNNAQKEYSTMLDASKRATGELTGETGKLGNMFERQLMRIGIGIAIWSTLRAAQEEIQKTIQAMEQYSVNVARFAAVTEQSIGAAIQQYNALREAAVQAGYTPSAAAPGIQEASRFTKQPDQQEELVTQAARLSQALGLKDITQATQSLGAANLSTGKSYQELANLAYAAYQRVGGDAKQFMDIFPMVQALVDETGGSFEEMFANVARGAAAAGGSMSEVGQVVNRFSENINNLSGDKILQFSQQLKSLTGVEPLNADFTLRSVDEIISAVAQKWETFSPEIQTKILDVLAGGKLKQQLRTAGVAMMSPWGDGLGDGADQALEKVGSRIEESFGIIRQRIRARAEAMREDANMVGAMQAEVAGGDVAILLGNLEGALSGKGAAEGGRAAAKRADIFSSLAYQGQQKTKEETLKSFTGMSESELQQAVDEYNAILNRIHIQSSQIDVSEALISDAEKNKLIAAAGGTGSQAGNALNRAFAQVVAEIGAPVIDGLRKAMPGIFGMAKEAGKAAAEAVKQSAAGPRLDVNTPQGAFGARMEVYTQSITPGSKTYDPTAKSPIESLQTVDLRKSTQDEINAAEQLSLELARQRVQLEYELTLATTGDVLAAQAAAAALQDQIDKTVTLVRTTDGLKAVWGGVGKYIQDAAAQIKQQQQEKDSNFAFQRLRNVEPSQFPQLEQLSQMYNQFLTNIGSPEPNKNVNLLLGEDNVFKTMNVRMTALQLALEDLTKTEKAQLSGTWNLPAGATALVPIQSLDIQRWNKADSSGLSAEAIRALLNATGQSGDQVSGAVDRSAEVISSTIREVWDKAGVAYTEPKLAQATNVTKTAIEAAIGSFPIFGTAMLTAFQRDRGQMAGDPVRAGAPINATLEGVGDTFKMFAQNLARPLGVGVGGRFGPLAGGGAGGGAGTDEAPDIRERQRPTSLMARQQTTAVSISALPIKATFNANVAVMLNGQVVARALMPILYQMISRLMLSTGVRPKGTQR